MILGKTRAAKVSNKRRTVVVEISKLKLVLSQLDLALSFTFSGTHRRAIYVARENLIKIMESYGKEVRGYHPRKMFVEKKEVK